METVKRRITDLPRIMGGPERKRRGKRGCHRSALHPMGKPFVVHIRIEGTTYNIGYTATEALGYERFRRAYRYVYGIEPW